MIGKRREHQSSIIPAMHAMGNLTKKSHAMPAECSHREYPIKPRNTGKPETLRNGVLLSGMLILGHRRYNALTALLAAISHSLFTPSPCELQVD